MPERAIIFRRAVARPRESRPNSAERGYGARWSKLRKVHLDENPNCVECLKEGFYVPAREVDHVIPHRGNIDLLLDPANLQSLCKSCHSRKTALYDGGFGRPRKGA